MSSPTVEWLKSQHITVHHIYGCITHYCDHTLTTPTTRAANYCRTSDNVRLNSANVRAKVILIGHWSDHKKNCHIHFFAVTKSDCKFTQFAFWNEIYEAFFAFYLTLRQNGYTYLSPDLYLSCDIYNTIYVRPNLVATSFPGSLGKTLVSALSRASSKIDRPRGCGESIKLQTVKNINFANYHQ
jgi:hypothetical protein